MAAERRRTWWYTVPGTGTAAVRAPEPITKTQAKDAVRSALKLGRRARLLVGATKAEVTKAEVTKAPKKRRTSRRAAAPPRKRKTSRATAPRKRKSSGTRPSASRTRDAQQIAIDQTRDLLRRWGVTGWTVTFNRRQTRAMGLANLRAKTIKYSPQLWERATAAQRSQTVIHEVAHAIVREQYGYSVKPHGKEWKAQMRAMGVEPRRTHSVSREGLKRKRKDTIEMVCCGKQFRVTLKRAVKGLRCKCDGTPPRPATSEDRRRLTGYMTPNICGLT